MLTLVQLVPRSLRFLDDKMELVITVLRILRSYFENHVRGFQEKGIEITQIPCHYKVLFFFNIMSLKSSKYLKKKEAHM